jgi:hypothetical protein
MSPQWRLFNDTVRKQAYGREAAVKHVRSPQDWEPKIKKTMSNNRTWSFSLPEIQFPPLPPLLIGSCGTEFPLLLFCDLFEITAIRVSAKASGPDNESIVAPKSIIRQAHMQCFRKLANFTIG